MLEVFPHVAPIFAMIALGALLHWRDWVSEASLRGLNDFNYRLPMPALMFSSASSTAAVGGDSPLAFFAGCFAVYALGLGLARWVFGLRLTEAAFFGLNASFGNNVSMGIPLILAVFATAGLEPLLGIIALQAITMLPPAIIIAELGLNADGGVRRALVNTVTSVLKNPIVISVLAGTLWVLLLPPVPGPARRTLEMLGAAAPPLALFCLGASLVQMTVGREWALALFGVCLKLAVVPMLVWLAARGLGLSAFATSVVTVTAGLPTGPNAAMLSRVYDTGGSTAGSMVFIGTVVSVASLALLIFLTRPWGARKSG